MLKRRLIREHFLKIIIIVISSVALYKYFAHDYFVQKSLAVFFNTLNNVDRPELNDKASNDLTTETVLSSNKTLDLRKDGIGEQRLGEVMVAKSAVTSTNATDSNAAGTTLVSTVGRPTPLCALTPPGLVGGIAVDMRPASVDDVVKTHSELKPGGRWWPSDCAARHRVAVIIPYRDRTQQLAVFLRHMHPFLQKQQLDYGIYVVELVAGTNFNRALLMNIGFVEALKLHDYQCFVFHDVDLLPEDDRNIYSCPESPRHLSAAVDKFGYQLPYVTIFGGASVMTKEMFVKANGYSNRYFGWGGEDDEMYNRLVWAGYSISRYPLEIARYKMFRHTTEAGNAANPERFNLLRTGKRRWKRDGINKLLYDVKSVDLFPLYTRVLVDFSMEKVLQMSIYGVHYNDLERAVATGNRLAIDWRLQGVLCWTMVALSQLSVL